MCMCVHVEIERIPTLFGLSGICAHIETYCLHIWVNINKQVARLH